MSGVLMAAIAATLIGGVMQAQPDRPGRATLLGQPCRARQVLGGTVVRDRKTGREMFAVTNMNEAQGGELILIDVERDSARVFRFPTGAGSWNVREVPGDRLVIGTFFDGTFLIFDLRAERFVHHVRFGKEEYLWNTAVGADGRIYTGTYPGGRLGALDLESYTVEDCGAPAPPNLYLRYVSATHDGRLLCSFSTEKPIEKLYDPRTRAWSDVPEAIKGVSVAGTWDGYLTAGSRLFAGPGFTPVAPMFLTPPADQGAWSIDPTLTTDTMLVLRQGKTVYGWRKGEPTLTRLAEADLRGGRYMGVLQDGRLVGIRGQDYFVCRPGETAPRLRPIPGESSPRNLFFLKVDERGRVWSGAPFGQTLMCFDPRTRKAVNTRTVCDGGGEVYDVAFQDGRVYAVAYSGGDIIVYEPDRPWDQWNNKNPRTIASVTPGYIRPVAGARFGPDGKLYSGWMAGYGRYGGAVAVTDPATGATELIENPLGEQAVSGLAVDMRPGSGMAYVGTSLEANGLPHKQGELPRFGVLDIAARKVLFSREFAGAGSVRSIVFDPQTNLVAFIAGTQMRLFDPERRAFLPLPDDLPQPRTGLVLAPASAPGSRPSAQREASAGAILFGSGKDLIAFRTADRTWRKIAEPPENFGNVAVSSQCDIYLSAGPSLYRIAW